MPNWQSPVTGTVTEFAPVEPGVKLMCEAVGRGEPAAYSVRKPLLVRLDAPVAGRGRPGLGGDGSSEV